MIIRWERVIEELQKVKIKYNRADKTISINLKSKGSYLYKVLSLITPTFIELWKKEYDIELEFDMTLKSPEHCKIMKCNELEMVILRNVTPNDWGYFQYVLNHKTNVLYNGLTLINFLGLEQDRHIRIDNFFWHDMSKFSKYEWKQYATYFNDTEGNSIPKEQLVKSEEIKQAFKHHDKHNSHHSDYHIAGSLIKPMPLNDILEMFADWKTMSNFLKSNIYEWYKDNHKKLNLNHITSKMVEKLLVQCEQWYKDKKFIKLNFVG